MRFISTTSCLLFGLLASLFGHTSSLTFTSQGGSGEICGSEGTRCLARSTICNVGECGCTNRRYPIGKGRIACYRRSQYFTEVVNDPTIKTFNGETIDFPLPCRYLLSHVKSGLENRRKQNIGECMVKVHAIQKKDKGKFYLAGYDVAIKIDYDSGTTFMASIRKMGIANNGQYDFVINATNMQYLPNGPWASDVIDYFDSTNNVRVRCVLDGENNLVAIVVKKCGIRIRFRPYDQVLRRNQTMVPGLTFDVSRAFPPIRFLSPNEVMALIPVAQSNGIHIDSILLPGLGRVPTMIHRALTANIEQNQPDPNPQCTSELGLDDCDLNAEMEVAFKSCLWILKSPRFIRCYDQTESGELILELFNLCTAIHCANKSCSEVQQKITDSGCNTVLGYQSLTDFMAGSLCTLP